VQKRLLSGIPLTPTDLAGTHGFIDRLVELHHIGIGYRQGRLITCNAWPHLAGHGDLSTHR
jgi:hypothetical protein